jgi:hypothetical protein
MVSPSFKNLFTKRRVCFFRLKKLLSTPDSGVRVLASSRFLVESCSTRAGGVVGIN